MRIRFPLFSILLCAVFCNAQAPGATPEGIKEIPGFDVTAIDKAIDPCVDFYQYACGNWMKTNVIPADKSRWGRFDQLQEHNFYVMRDILEGVQSKPKSPVEKKVGDYYAACMNEEVIEKAAAAPIQPEMKRIAAIRNRQELIAQVAQMHSSGLPALFSFYSQPDMHDATQTIAYIDQGGITLPDRDYYLKDDAKSKETRERYQQHVQKMFELAGDAPDVAAQEAKTVLAVETGLAQVSMDRTERRDPKNRDHLMKTGEAQTLAPNFELAQYFAQNGSPKFTKLNVGNPEFFKQVNEQLNSVPLADWKTYLRWRTINEYAPVLSKSFVDEDFEFNGKYLSGQKGWSRAGSVVYAPPTAVWGWRWASFTLIAPSVLRARSAP